MGIRVQSDLDAGLSERWLRDERSLDTFLSAFRECSIPHREWTHRAHLGVAAALILEMGADSALGSMRATIPRLNESHGGANTNLSGYHETLTVFWVRLLSRMLSRLPKHLSRLDKVTVAVEAYGVLRRLDRAVFDSDVLGDAEARLRWTYPDRGPDWLRGA